MQALGIEQEKAQLESRIYNLSNSILQRKMQGKAANNHESLSQSRIQSGKHVNTLSHQNSFGKFEIQGQHTDFNTKKDFQQFLKNKSPYR